MQPVSHAKKHGHTPTDGSGRVELFDILNQKSHQNIPGPSIGFAKGIENTPPGSPVDRDVYLVGDSPSGDWSGHPFEVAMYNGKTSSWEFYAPEEGQLWFSITEKNFYIYNEPSAWRLIGTYTDWSNITNRPGFDLGEQAKIYFISGVNGDDANGNGSIYFPFATIQKAIDTETSDSILIVCDPYVTNQTVSIPAGKTVLISSNNGVGGLCTDIDLTVSSDDYIALDNIELASLTIASGTPTILMHKGIITGAIEATAAFMYFDGTEIAEDIYSSCTFSYIQGYMYIRNADDNLIAKFFQGLDANGAKITGVGEPEESTDAATKGYVDSGGDFPLIFWVSSTRGSDEYGNGSIVKPWATIQKAIDEMLGDGDRVEIVADQYTEEQVVSVPAGKTVYVSSIGGPSGRAIISSLTLGVGAAFYGNSISIADIYESGSATPYRNIYLEECYLKNSFTLPATYVHFFGTRMDYAKWVGSSAKGVFGSLNIISGALLSANKLDMNGNQIINLADPVNSQDAVTLNYLTGKVMQPDVNLAGATPVSSDVSGWSDGDKGFGIGTTGRIFLMYKYSGGVKYVELS